MCSCYHIYIYKYFKIMINIVIKLETQYIRKDTSMSKVKKCDYPEGSVINHVFAFHMKSSHTHIYTNFVFISYFYWVYSP